MTYIRINKTAILFILLFLLPERIFFLVNQSRFQSLFRIKYSDFVMIIYFLAFFYAIFKFKIDGLKDYYFASNVLLIMPLVVIASIVSKVGFGQGLYDTFWAQKDFFMMIFSYLFFRTLLVKKIITKECLWNYIYKLSFLITGVMIVQHAMANYVQILSVRYTARFGVRITDNYTYSTILLIGSLLLFFKTESKKEKRFAIVGMIMSYYHCIFVSQTRIVMIAYGVLTIITALFFTDRVLKKITYLFIAMGLILIILQTELGQYFLSAIMDSSTDSSAQIRQVGRLYYLMEISKSPLFGRGYPLSYEAIAASGATERIYLNDNGLFGFGYLYGIIGLIWYIFLTVKMFVCSFKCIKADGDYRYLLYTLFLQVICVNIIWWYWQFSFGIIFTVMLAFMEEYSSRKSEAKVRFYFGG